MFAPDPAHLDTLEFSGLDESELKRRALFSRDGIDLYAHELSFVRRRVTGKQPDLPSLIVLPDGPATLESYDDFIEQLSDRFNIAIVEVPGFGFSYATSPSALEFETTCKILAAAIDDLSLPNAVLVGACVQGLMAARIAELIAHTLAGVIIAQTGDFDAEVDWAKHAIDTKGNLAQPYTGQLSFRFARERATVDWWSAFVAGPQLDLDTFQTEARKVLRCGCSYALASQIQKWGATNPRPEFSAAVPVAIIWGLADPSHINTDKQSIRRYFPEALYLEHEGLGHFPDLEAPELFAETALKLID